MRRRNKWKKIEKGFYERTKDEHIRIEEKDRMFVVEHKEWSGRDWDIRGVSPKFKTFEEAEKYVGKNYEMEYTKKDLYKTAKELKRRLKLKHLGGKKWEQNKF